MNYEKILFIGPDYKKHTGGIGAVLEVYSRSIVPFKFIATYKGNFNLVLNIVLFAISIIKLFNKLIFDRKIRVIHIHGASYGSFYRKFIVFKISKSLFKKKVIYHVHGAEYKLFYNNSNWLTKSIIASVINNSDMIICLSKKWKDFFLSSFEPDKIDIVNNPIEPVEFEPSFEKNKIEFLFLGRIGERKGIFDLLDVIRENKDRYKERIFLRIGGDGDSKFLKRYILDNNIESIVKYEGWIVGEEKNELLSSSHVYILPSYNEGLPVSLLEAMNFGLAIVATDVGGISEIVENGENGFLIHPGNKKEIKEAIDYFINNTSEIKKMGAISKHMVERYEISSVLINLEKIYDGIIKE